MPENVAKEALDAAIAYERLHVPALFGQWAPRVAAAAGIGAGQRVLDVACGTGVLARELARRTGDPANVTGIDIAPGMLAAARQIAPEIDWQEGSAGALPFPDATFDAVVSQFGLMFFEDRPGALREMRRVLRDGGTMALAVWGPLEDAPAYAETARLLERTAGERAGDALRTPFILGDKQLLGEIFAEAGLGAAELSTLDGSARFPGVRTMVEAELRGWLPVMGVSLDEDAIAAVLLEAEDVLRSYTLADGSVEFPIRAHLATASLPGK